MEHINQVIQNAEHAIDHSSKTSPTAAGQPLNSGSLNNNRTDAEQQNHNNLLIDTINQIFSLFRVNYHNQFYAAYSDSETLNQAKKMWFQSLRHVEPETLLAAAKKVIESSEYLPTLFKFLGTCDEIDFALPSAQNAFIEACMATEPRENFTWSHPMIYHAGKATGWFFLRSQPEQKTFPTFEKNFHRLANDLRQGVIIAEPTAKQIEKPEEKVLDKEEQKKRLQKLRAELSLE